MTAIATTVDAEYARQLTDRIKVAVAGTWHLITEAYQSRAWSVLGYATWDDYCTREFGTARLKLPREDRISTVQSLRDAGLSLRAIESATGHSQHTIIKDLAEHQVLQSAAPEPEVPAGVVDAETGEFTPDDLGDEGSQEYTRRPSAPKAAAKPPVPKIIGIDGKIYTPPTPKVRVVKPVPEGMFATVVADPPWRYDNTSTRGAAEGHYSTMSIDELCALDVVREKAADQSHLYLWSTAGHLPDAFRVMEAWGFTYKTYLVWVKPQMGMGNYFRVSTELVLFGIKGDLGTNSNSIMNYFNAPRGKHSAKPAKFQDIVALASPGPYLELFSRCTADDVLHGCACSKCRLGWSTWGDQS